MRYLTSMVVLKSIKLYLPPMLRILNNSDFFSVHPENNFGLKKKTTKKYLKIFICMYTRKILKYNKELKYVFPFSYRSLEKRL